MKRSDIWWAVAYGLLAVFTVLFCVTGGFAKVKIAPNAKPPVCKIVDYGKYRYEQARREKEAKKIRWSGCAV